MFFREILELLIVFITTWSAALHVTPTPSPSPVPTPSPSPTVWTPTTSAMPIPQPTANALRAIGIAANLEIRCDFTREQHGLNVLKTHGALEEMAWIRAQQIAYDFSHETPDGSLYVYELAKQANVTGGWVGEILAKVADNENATGRIWELWMASLPHYEVITGRWDYMGVSAYREGGVVYAVIVFWDIP